MENENLPSKKTSLAITHIAWSIVLTVAIAIIFTYSHLFEDTLALFLIELPEVTDPITFIFWVLLGIVNVIIFIVAIIFIVLAKMLAVFIIALIALPSLIGGFAMIKPRTWAFKLLLVSGIFSVLMPPLGTALGIWTIRSYSKESRRLRNIRKPVIDHSLVE